MIFLYDTALTVLGFGEGGCTSQIRNRANDCPEMHSVREVYM